MFPKRDSFLFRSLWYDRGINLAVMIGVMCAAAVISGALLVGDSMRGSLKAMTLDRLGPIDTILLAGSFFSEPELPLEKPWTSQTPAVLYPASAGSDENVTEIQVLGLKRIGLDRDEIELNQTAADRLGVKPGDSISLRMMPLAPIPPDSTLGRKNATLLRSRVVVRNIVPDTGWGRFSLKADQQAEPLALVPIDWIRRKLDVGQKINAVFFSTDHSDIASNSAQRETLERSFHPSTDDLGIVIDGDYVKSARMFFSKRQAGEIRRFLPENTRETLVYLVTSAQAVKNRRETPYSTVSTLDRLRGNEIAVNRWTADDLDVEPGDEIELTWFEPESVHGETVSKTRRFTLKEILPMKGIGADPKVVPDVKGFTDEKSIADWDPPFPFDAKKIRKKDEEYWDVRRAAPKLFVSPGTGRELWGSRFGDTTTFCLEKGAGGTLDADRLGKSVSPSLFGFTFLPVKQQGLAASAGTTPFFVLFLSFSFFIVASALMLVALLFRLSVEIKAKRIGLLAAVGWPAGKIVRELILEGICVSAMGGLFGTLSGLLYARIMVYGLTTWWVDAVTIPFVELHVNPASLVAGFASSVILSLITIYLSIRRATAIPTRALLAGNISYRENNAQKHRDSIFGKKSVCRDSRKKRASEHPERNDESSEAAKVGSKTGIQAVYGGQYLPGYRVWGVMIGISLGCLLPTQWGEYDAPIFFGMAVVWLLFGLLVVRGVLARWGQTAGSLPGLAFSNAARNRTRSMLCVALIASTTFLVLSIGAFRLDPATATGKGWDSAGFSYIGETAFPVYHDIAKPEGREQLSIQSDDERYLETKKDASFVSFRLNDGDDASCLNLYQTGKPRVLGVPKSWSSETISYDFFRQAGNRLSPWNKLNRPMTVDPDGVRRIPVILDSNTAMYSLHLYGGVGETYETTDNRGDKIRCEIVAFLNNSVFQGVILMGEENFLHVYPEVGGYRFFLFTEKPFSNHPDVRMVKIVYDMLGDYGFRGEPVSNRLRKLFAVQNTYLSTFQSLGGIGLLLGMFGLAVIQARNVLERRKELALLQAVGFAKGRTIRLLLYEGFFLLFLGLVLAFLTTMIALLPIFVSNTTTLNPGSFANRFLWLVGGLAVIGVVSNIAASLAVLRISVARELAEEH